MKTCHKIIERTTAAALLCLALATQAQPVPRQTLAVHLPTAARSAPVGRMEATRSLTLAIGLPLRHRDELDDLLRRMYDPASPDFHQYLSVEQFTERFGPTREDYEALSAFARANGFKVTATHSNRMVLDVEAPVAQIEKVLRVTMRVYRHPAGQRNFFAPDAEPSLDLAVPVLHISGLNDFVVPQPMIHARPAAGQGNATPVAGSAPGGSYLGNDFRAAYFPDVTLTGAGQKVGLLEFSSGFSQSDITAYEKLAGLPNVPMSEVLLDGYNGSLGDGNSEVSLDIEMAIAMAPNLAGVIVYEGINTDDILNRMATDNTAKQLSASWMYPIDATSDQDFLEFALQGQSFFNASGDGDAWVGPIAAPCDDTNITIVGGTTLATGAGGSWRSEQAWNLGYDPPGWAQAGDGYVGSGGGISTTYSLPPWQNGISMTANQGSPAMRNIPDVALTADNIYVTYSNGLAGPFWGTSCAAPLWAGVAALLNQQAAANGEPPVGFLNPAIYAIGKGANYTNCFHDITIGSNTNGASPAQFPAVPGYDLCTGWGTPAGQPFIDALAPDALAISPVAGLYASGPVGGPFTNGTMTMMMTNRGTVGVNWKCINTPAWLTVSPSSGTVLPGQPAMRVSVALNSAANNLAAGVYKAALWFTNLTDGIVQRRENVLLANPSETSGTYGQAVLALQPAAYWPLNETLVPPAADVAANAGSLGLVGNGFPFDNVSQGQTGIVGTCFYFTNSTLNVPYLGTYVDVPFAPVLNPNGPFTVELWARPNQLTTDYFCPVSSVDDTANTNSSRFGWIIYEASSNHWEFRLGSYTGYVATVTGGTVLAKQWQHVAGVYDGVHATLYVNGLAVAGPISASGYGPNTNPTVTLRMGATSFGNRTFDGALDEVAVYTNALSASTVAAHYHAASTNNAHYGQQILTNHPVGYWHLDEPAYSAVSPDTLPTAFNLGSLGPAADGIYQPGALPGVAGVPGAGFGVSNLACGFGASSCIDVPAGPLDNFTGPLTLVAWIKALPTLGQVQSVASLGAGGCELTVDGQGRAEFTDGPQPAGSLVTASRVDDGQWHQLAGVYDGSSSEFLYVDGRLAVSTSGATSLPVAGIDDFWIGGDPDAGAFQFFNGAMDEVAVFGTALTADQMLRLYSIGTNATPLRAAVTSPSPGGITLTWAAVSGLTYEVQYTTNLGLHDNWTVLGSPILATNSMATALDRTTNSQRYYRIVLLP